MKGGIDLFPVGKMQFHFLVNYIKGNEKIP